MEFSLSKLWQIKKIIAFAMANAELFDRIVANSKAVIGDVTELISKLPEAFKSSDPDDDKIVTYGEGWALLEADPDFVPYFAPPVAVAGDVVAGAIFDGSRIKKLYDTLTNNPQLVEYLKLILKIAI
jgi:hypothetical protein